MKKFNKFICLLLVLCISACASISCSSNQNNEKLIGTPNTELENSQNESFENSSNINEDTATCTHEMTIISATAPTCTREGKTEGIRCLKCDEILVKQETISKIDHNYNNWEIVTEATEDTEGLKIKICIDCRYETTATIPVLNHVHQSNAVWKSNESFHWKTCSCEVTLEFSDHTYSEWDIITQATCDSIGTKERFCTICNYTEADTLPIQKHSWENATCDTPKTCSLCNKTEGSVLNHKWENNQCIYCKLQKIQYVTLTEASIYSGNLILANLQNKLHFLEADNLLSIKKDGGSSHLLVSVFKHQLGSEALSALATLAEDFHTALSENSDRTVMDLLVTDAYHTSDEQQALFDQKLDPAPAGYSDFQTGLSVSLKFFDGTFTYTIGNHQAEAETAWLMQNYAKYGFILRYPEGKKDQTGYDANNAHFRYVGVPHAQYITENNLSLEEYVELLRGYTMEKPLQIVVDGVKYSVYYTASQGTESTVAVPGFSTAVDYSISGNNVDGFIVTVKAHWI